MSAIFVNGLSDTNFTQFARLDLGESALKVRDKGSEELDLVAPSNQDNHGDVSTRDGLLILELLIDRDQHLKLRFGQP